MEILMKIRVWNKERKGFCENDGYNYWLLDMDGELHHIQGRDHHHIEQDDQIENYIIQLSTGLKDKNGKEIYEGDLVNDLTPYFCSDQITNSFIQQERTTNPLEVYWCKGESQFRMKNDQHEYHEPINNRRIEVIGNIFENPELINEASTL